MEARQTSDITPQEWFEFDTGRRLLCPDAMNFSLVIMQLYDPKYEWVSGIPGHLDWLDIYSRFSHAMEHIQYVRRLTLNPLLKTDKASLTKHNFGIEQNMNCPCCEHIETKSKDALLVEMSGFCVVEING